MANTVDARVLLRLAKEREQRAEKRARKIAAIKAAYEHELANLTVKFHMDLLLYLMEEAAEAGKPSFSLMRVEIPYLTGHPSRDENAADLLLVGTVAARVYDRCVASGLKVTLQRQWTDVGATWYEMLVFVPGTF